VQSARTDAGGDAAVFGTPPAVVAPAREILRHRACTAVEQRRQAAPQHQLGGHAHLVEDLAGGVVGQDRQRELVDDRAVVGFFVHQVQRRAGLGLAFDHRPVHRHPAAVLRQQRSVHVVGAARGHCQQRRAEHRPVVERKQEIGARGAHAREHRFGVRIIGGDHRDPVVFGGSPDAVEPDFLAGTVVVRDHQRDLDAARQQRLQAAHADVVVREDDRHAHGSSRFSSTAEIM